MIGEILASKCKELESIGCAGIAFCANTPHRVFDMVQNELGVPLVHIGRSIGKRTKKLGYKKVGLLGTRFTMEGGFIDSILQREFSIDVETPAAPARKEIQSLLYNEMSHGHFQSKTRDYFLSLIEQFNDNGAEAVILGCTEFPILLNNVKTCIPTIDSTMCHVEDIVDFILQ